MKDINELTKLNIGNNPKHPFYEHKHGHVLLNVYIDYMESLIDFMTNHAKNRETDANDPYTFTAVSMDDGPITHLVWLTDANQMLTNQEKYTGFITEIADIINQKFPNGVCTYSIGLWHGSKYGVVVAESSECKNRLVQHREVTNNGF